MIGERSTIVDVGAEEIDWLLLFPLEKKEVVAPKRNPRELRTPTPRPAAYRRAWLQWFFGFACALCAAASGIVLFARVAPQPDAPLLPVAPTPRLLASVSIAAVAVMPDAPVVPDSLPVAATSGAITQSGSSIGNDGPERRYLGTLRVDSEPPGARVFVNNEYAGETPLLLGRVPAGSRAVRLQLEGYEPWSRGIRVVANESTVVAAQLTPDQER